MNLIYSKIIEVDGMKHPKISIIIRGKNESKWLKILLRELFLQTYKDYEIIYCDNDSSDNSIEVCKKFNIKKILKIKKYTPGLSLNKGVKIAKGKYLVFISSHCIPCSKNWLKNLVKFQIDNPNLSASYGKQIPLPGTNSKNALDMNIIFRDEIIIHHKDPYISNANSIYLADNLKKNLFNTNVTNIEDRLWAINETKRGGKIGYNPTAEVFHLHGIHQHNDETLRSQRTVDILNKNFLKIWNRCKFLKSSYFNFLIIINARREKNKSSVNKKIDSLKKNIFYSNLGNPVIVVITDLNLRKVNNLVKIKPSNTLEKDLKNIYKKFKKKFLKTNYVLTLNTQGRWKFREIKELIEKTIYYSRLSGTFHKDFNGNFIVEFPDRSNFKNVSLINQKEKPKLKLLLWKNGCLIDPDYLRRGLYFDDQTYLFEFKD